jgi:hypothetical protein
LGTSISLAYAVQRGLVAPILSDDRPARDNGEPVIERLLAILILVVIPGAGIALFHVSQRRARCRKFLRSLTGILEGPRREAIELPATAEATGLYQGRRARIRLEDAKGLWILTVAVDCRAALPLDRQPYRLEVVLDSSKHPDLDPGRIRAVVRDATTLAEMCEQAGS